MTPLAQRRLILALDTATTTGWAAGEPGEMPQWGARTFKGASNGEVIGTFRAWLNHRCYEFQPTLIVFESPYIPRFEQRAGGPPPMNPLTLRRLLGFVAEVEAVAWELRIECREATTTETAKFFTGRGRFNGGRAEKKAAVVEMCRRYGWDVGESDDAADALALWAMAEAHVDAGAAMARGVGPLFLGPPETKTPRSGQTARRRKETKDESRNLFSAVSDGPQPISGNSVEKIPA